MTDPDGGSDDENDDNLYSLSAFYGPGGVLSPLCLYLFPEAAVINYLAENSTNLCSYTL